MNPSARSAVLLVLIGIFSLGSTLAWRHWTAPSRLEAERQLHNLRWLQALPAGSFDNQPLQAPVALGDTHLPHSRLLAGYRATLDGKPSAVLLHSQTQGYAGPITLAIAIDPAGRLVGTHVLEQQESPGLGDQLVDPRIHWLDQFTGRTQEGAWAIKRDNGDYDQLAGATVTSRAVIDALQDALRYFDAHRATLLEAQTDE